MGDQRQEKVTLKSTNHRQQLCTEICQFLDDNFMVDITVTCHGNQTKVHKLMLAIFCPVLRDSLVSHVGGAASNEHVDSSNNPTIPSLNLDYLARQRDDVDYLVEWIYKGEVTVSRDRLKGLLDMATNLGVTGLMKAIEKLKQFPPEDDTAVPTSKKQPGRRGRPKRKQQSNKSSKIVIIDESLRESISESMCKSAEAEKAARDQSALPPKRRFRRIEDKVVAAEKEDLGEQMQNTVASWPNIETACDDFGDGEDNNSSQDQSDTESTDVRTNSMHHEDRKCEHVPGVEITAAESRLDELIRDAVEEEDASLANKKSVRRKMKRMHNAISRTESRKLWRLKRPIMKCDYCKYETQDKGSFKSHVAKHDPEADRFVCDVCAKTFRSKRGFRCHTRSHYEPEHLHKCAHCEFHTPQKWSWLQHLAVIHKVDPQGNPLSENIICEVCSKSFVAEHQLKAHMIRKHTLDKPYKCELCPYAAVIRYELDKHISIKHNNERRFLCELCSFRSQTQSGFERHKRSHTGVKPFTCTICGKLYADNRKLKSHLLQHENDEKSWVCHLCGHACRRKDNLQMHLKRIHKATMDSGSCDLQDPPSAENTDSVFMQLSDPASRASITHCIPNSLHEMAYDNAHPSADTNSLPNLMVYEDHETLVFKNHPGNQLAIGEEFAMVVTTPN